MNKRKTTIFLTDATGKIGYEGFKQLLDRTDHFNIIVLALPTKKNIEKMLAYKGHPGVKIVWGDLTKYNDVYKCVENADYVQHIGGKASSDADYNMKCTTAANLGAVRNIIRAIKAQPNRDDIKLIYMGTIAEYGDRNIPIHWGRTGDPIKINIFDNYAAAEAIAEREVIESGLKYWISLRLNGVLHAEMSDLLNPILFHMPVNGVFEWITAKDSGRLLANTCEENIPKDFWRKIYNIGGGSKYRTINYLFIQKVLKAIGIEDIRKVTDLNWFATKNFYGYWFEDSDILEDYLHFRTGSLDDFFKELGQNLAFPLKLTKFIPSFFIKKYIQISITNQESGTLYWLKNNDTDRIAAFFGSKEKFNRLTGWREHKIIQPTKKPLHLNHGYDENKPKSELDILDMKFAAEFRGGKCLSVNMVKGDLYTKLKWTCAFGHEFDASPALILLGGHWCPECMPALWNYDEEAKRNPFFAQVWYPLRQKNENNYYDNTHVRKYRNKRSVLKKSGRYIKLNLRKEKESWE